MNLGDCVTSFVQLIFLRRGKKNILLLKFDIFLFSDYQKVKECDMSLNYFDAIIYINLTHRKDREKLLLKELRYHKVKKNKIHRISARYAPFNGHKGCALSHIDALDLAIKMKWKNVLILEDDCFFLKRKKLVNAYIEYLTTVFQNNWDILFLGCRVIEDEKTQFPYIKRVLNCVRAHAYAVNGHYLKTLRKNYLESYKVIKNCLFYFQAYDNAIDQKWEKLLKKDRCYIGENNIAGQRTNFSDIGGKKLKKDLIKKKLYLRSFFDKQLIVWH